MTAGGSAWMRRATGLVLAIAAFVAAPPSAPAADPPATAFRWIRDAITPEACALRIATEAAGRGCDSVLFVFDVLSFAPPPGRNEFAANGNLRYDLPAWFAALDAAAAKGPPVYAATSRSRHPVAVAGAWTGEIRAELAARWWDDRKFKAFAPPERWVRRLGGPVPGGRPAIVLIASEMPPEARAAGAAAGREVPPEETRWRNRLLDRGAGFAPEKVGNAVGAIRGVFFAIAPEARFGDFLPDADLPQFPWAARPRAMQVDGRLVPAVTGDDAAPERGGGLPPRPGGRRRSRGGDAAAGDDGRDPGGRFIATTPRFQRRPEFNTDCPSGYGWWPYARAAAKTGGACLLYPFPPKPWADDCPRYEPLLDALAPETCSAAELRDRLRRDPVVEILARAQAIVFDRTPWTDAGREGGAAAASAPGEVRGDASSWFGFEMTSEVVPAKRWTTRDVPRDEVGGQRSLEQWMRYGEELRGVAERYDRASGVLDAAVADLAAGKLALASRRSQANLRLARFWNAMSAFHLRALSIYLAELDTRVPKPVPREILITYLPAVRMSDCLGAYDERAIAWEGERGYGWSQPYRAKGGQGNFLRVPLDDPNYRAKRDLDRVLLHLDPRLLPSALRTIAAAEDVMAHEGRSAWGWVTYYSELDTFIWEPVPDPRGPAPQPGPKSKKEKGPKTPAGDAPPPPASPGSDGGGGSSTGK